MHDHTHQYNNMGEQRISNVPAYIKSLPHMSFLDDHSSFIIGKYGEIIKLFTRQMDRAQQLLTSLLWKPLALTQLLSVLEAELKSLNSIHTSYQPLIQAATELLKKEPSFNRVPVSSKHMRRNLLPFLGNALSWLTGTATTKDVNSIKTRINQLITTQHNQQDTLVHVISILSITRYTTQVNRQHINVVMNAAKKDTWGCHNTVQHHTFPIQQLKLPANCTPHLIHLG